MKKFGTGIIAMIMGAVMLTSCGSSNEVKEVSVDKLAEDMLSATTVVAELVNISEDNMDMLYSDFDADDIAEYKVYACASKASAEEIAVFKAASADDVDDVKEMAQQRVEDLITEMRDYNPNEMTKLENPLILTKGNYVALVLADDTSKAEEAFEAAFK